MSASKPSKGRIIVFGIVFWYPLAGVTYQFLHYLLGLRKLGYDPYYVEDMMWTVYDPALGEFTDDWNANLRAIGPVLDAHGFAGKWAFRTADSPADQYVGMTTPQVNDLFRTADALLNVTGGHELGERHMRIPRRLYVESDPFASQVRIATGDRRTIDFVGAHTHHFSFGENLGKPDCIAPVERFDWQPTRQPVDMDLWRTDAPGGSAYTTVTTWQNKTEPVEWRGQRYHWTKDIEFRKYLDLPSLRPNATFELATTSQPDVVNLLHAHRWRTLDSARVSGDHLAYRDYIQRSRAEFTVARDQYVRPVTGWFSDRTVCYLAAGRPVITEETGFSKTVKSGRGLFGFRTLDDILAAVDAIESDYPGHCRAARQVAAEYFDNTTVIGSMLARAGM